jgi:hypothetical protein
MLLQLPTELLLQILTYVYHSDLELYNYNFYLIHTVCKRFYNIINAFHKDLYILNKSQIYPVVFKRISTNSNNITKMLKYKHDFFI